MRHCNSLDACHIVKIHKTFYYVVLNNNKQHSFCPPTTFPQPVYPCFITIRPHITRYINGKRQKKFSLEDKMSGLEMFKHIRDGPGMGDVAIEKDFKAKKLFSVIPPMEAFSEMRRRDENTWFETPAFVDSPNGALPKMVEELRTLHEGNGIARSIMLNIKEATVGDKKFGFGNEFAGTDLVVTEVVSLEKDCPLHENYYESPRVDVKPFAVENIRYLSPSVGRTPY